MQYVVVIPHVQVYANIYHKNVEPAFGLLQVEFLRNLNQTLPEESAEKKLLEQMVAALPRESVIHNLRGSPSGTPQLTPPGTPGSNKKQKGERNCFRELFCFENTHTHTHITQLKLWEIRLQVVDIFLLVFLMSLEKNCLPLCILHMYGLNL